MYQRITLSNRWYLNTQDYATDRCIYKMNVLLEDNNRYISFDSKGNFHAFWAKNKQQSLFRTIKFLYIFCTTKQRL